MTTEKPNEVKPPESPLVFEDTRVFEEEQLLTFRLPKHVIDAYKKMAELRGVDVGVLMVDTLANSNMPPEVPYNQIFKTAAGI
jgi:hypothetical protein